MSASREIKSFWWFPGNPDTRWFGTLTLVSGETPQLELVIERESPAHTAPEIGPVIHGKDEHGAPITLLFCSSPGGSSSGAVINLPITAGCALLGIALPAAEAFVAHSLRFQLQHLHGWLDRSGFESVPPANTFTFAVHFRQQSDLWFQVGPDLELGIHNTFQSHNGFQERRVSEDAALTFRSKSGASLKRCQELIGALRALLHFASLKKVYPVWITAYQDGYGYQRGDTWHDQHIEVCNSALREPESEYSFSDRWLFQFKDVSGDFAGFLGKWLDYHQTFSEAIGCYFSTRYHSLTSELEHLSLTQALDAYHGVKFTSHDDQNFKQKVEDLCRLHEPSLIGLVDDIPDFSEKVLRTRNYYTHHKPRIMSG